MKESLAIIAVIVLVAVGLAAVVLAAAKPVDYAAGMPPGATMLYANGSTRIIKVDALCVRERWDAAGRWDFRESGPCDGVKP